ncbi:hypothetical protein LINPERPRIM_LOCUS23116 [Linum perenne]
MYLMSGTYHVPFIEFSYSSDNFFIDNIECSRNCLRRMLCSNGLCLNVSSSLSLSFRDIFFMVGMNCLSSSVSPALICLTRSTHPPNKHCDPPGPQLTQDKCGWCDDNPGRSTIALVMRDSSTTSLFASESCLGKVSYREI